MTKVKPPDVSRVGWAGIGLDKAIKGEARTREAVERSTQWDDVYDTKYDDQRCGAATAVAATALAGTNQMLHLLSGLEAERKSHLPRDARENVIDQLKKVKRDFDWGRDLSPKSLQRLQDALFATGQLDGKEASTEAEIVNYFRIAGFKGRRAPVGAFSRDRDQRLAQLNALCDSMRPGEMSCLIVPSERTEGGKHAVLLGRSNDGSLFLYDSSSKDEDNCLWVNQGEERELLVNRIIDAHKVVGAYGGERQGLLLSATPQGISWSSI